MPRGQREPCPRELLGRDLEPGMITYYRISKRGEISFKRDHMLLDRLPTLATHEQCIHFRTDRHSMVCYFLNGRVFVKGPFTDEEGNYVEPT